MKDDTGDGTVSILVAVKGKANQDEGSTDHSIRECKLSDSVGSNEYEEFNMFLDPSATKVVSTSSMNITLVPLQTQLAPTHFLSGYMPQLITWSVCWFTFQLFELGIMLSCDDLDKYRIMFPGSSTQMYRIMPFRFQCLSSSCTCISIAYNYDTMAVHERCICDIAATEFLTCKVESTSYWYSDMFHMELKP
ncbi:hypothetical protein V6N12_023738 [Hibiscus sabdariffa]|uniref:Uncharacterized protein n=1 Tax=Hibiscus sabdariffa TaxID=183260 RepID=A0ABR2FYK3_9ROSI